jgi:hypothetical protein
MQSRAFKSDFDRERDPQATLSKPIRFANLRSERLTIDIVRAAADRVEALGLSKPFADAAALHFVVGAFTALRLSEDPAVGELARTVLERVNVGGIETVKSILAEVMARPATASHGD